MALDSKTHRMLVGTSDFDAPAADSKQKSPQPRAKSGKSHLLIRKGGYSRGHLE
jgi:hypothetical protein